MVITREPPLKQTYVLEFSVKTNVDRFVHDGVKKQRTQSPVCPLRKHGFTPQRPFIFIQYVHSGADSITTEMYHIYKVGLFHAQLKPRVSETSGLRINTQPKNSKALQTPSHDVELRHTLDV